MLLYLLPIYRNKVIFFLQTKEEKRRNNFIGRDFHLEVNKNVTEIWLSGITLGCLEGCLFFSNEFASN